MPLPLCVKSVRVNHFCPFCPFGGWGIRLMVSSAGTVGHASTPCDVASSFAFWKTATPALSKVVGFLKHGGFSKRGNPEPMMLPVVTLQRNKNGSDLFFIRNAHQTRLRPRGQHESHRGYEFALLISMHPLLDPHLSVTNGFELNPLTALVIAAV